MQQTRSLRGALGLVLLLCGSFEAAPGPAAPVPLVYTW